MRDERLKILGDNIRAERMRKKISQEKLAEASNYALSFIGNLESDKIFQTISVGSLYHLSKVLGIHITELFQDLPNEEENK